MNIKSMLIKLAEEQADKMQEEAMKHLGSDEMTEKIASAINKKIDIPFVSEDKEQILYFMLPDSRLETPYPTFQYPDLEDYYNGQY